MQQVTCGVLSLGMVLISWNGQIRAAEQVDATTLTRKVMVGYQGWFRCPGDSSRDGWRHWSRNGKTITPESVTFEMWPDLSEFSDDEKYPTPGITDAKGNPAHLFSSIHPRTVRRHFEWMRDAGIDGVFLQRFLVERNNPSLNTVLQNVRNSARETGRVYAICYDLSGMSAETIVDALLADWATLVSEQGLTNDPGYLRHRGRPVLFVWGFFSDRFRASVANRLLDALQQDPRHPVTVVGGCQWWWRTEQDPEWRKAFRRLDVISPWNPGNSTVIDGEKHAATGSWREDLAEARRLGKDYLPVLYPGFGWRNLKGPAGARDELPRLGGRFYWRQFSTAADLGIDMAYVAMFDEVDEATAIFKVSNAPPLPGRFQTYEDLPADWYLRLTGEGTRLLHGDRPNQRGLPLSP